MDTGSELSKVGSLSPMFPDIISPLPYPRFESAVSWVFKRSIICIRQEIHLPIYSPHHSSHIFLQSYHFSFPPPIILPIFIPIRIPLRRILLFCSNHTNLTSRPSQYSSYRKSFSTTKVYNTSATPTIASSPSHKY